MAVKRRRPRKSVTLGPSVVAYVDSYASEHKTGTWSAALEAIIEEHAAGTRALALAAAVGDADPTSVRGTQIPGVLRPDPTPWMSP